MPLDFRASIAIDKQQKIIQENMNIKPMEPIKIMKFAKKGKRGTLFKLRKKY